MAIGLNLHEVPVTACAGCGVDVGNPEFLADVFCGACDVSEAQPGRLPYGAGLPVCPICGHHIFPLDAAPNGIRHRWCNDFHARLAAAHAATIARFTKEDAIAA